MLSQLSRKSGRNSRNRYFRPGSKLLETAVETRVKNRDESARVLSSIWGRVGSPKNMQLNKAFLLYSNKANLGLFAGQQLLKIPFITN